MRTTIRALALVTIALLIAYHVLRVVATQCSGAQCDVYIPLSLLIPVLVLISALVTGLVALSAARRDTAWFALLLVSIVVSVAGPLVILAILKDSPDGFVFTSTVLVIAAPLAALLYSFFGRSRVART